MLLSAAAITAVVATCFALWFTRLPANPAPRSGATVAIPGSVDAGVLREAVVAWSPAYRVSFFGIEKLHPADTHRADTIAAALLSDGLLDRAAFLVPAPVSLDTLKRVHAPAYIDSLSDAGVLSAALEVKIPAVIGSRRIDRRILLPFRLAVAGTRAAARHAAGGGLGINLGGGFHHAGPSKGHGFCVYNDVAVAIDALRQDGFDRSILIVDTDAHQGDGDHAFFAADPTVWSFSMQQAGLFPMPRETGDFDLDLPAGTGDEPFLDALALHLERQVTEQRPALIVHVAGADVLADDPITGLGLSPEGLVRRDLLVARVAEEAGAGLLHVLAGGYGPSAAEAQAASVAALLRGEWREAERP